MARPIRRDTSWFFDTKAFGKALREKRKEKRYTQTELTEAVYRCSSEKRAEDGGLAVEGFSIAQSTLAKWENGETLPTIDSLLALTTTLAGADWEDLTIELLREGMALPCLAETLKATIKKTVTELEEILEKQRKELELREKEVDSCLTDTDPEPLLGAISRYRSAVDDYNLVVASIEQCISMHEANFNGNSQLAAPAKRQVPARFSEAEKRAKQRHKALHPEEWANGEIGFF